MYYNRYNGALNGCLSRCLPNFHTVSCQICHVGFMWHGWHTFRIMEGVNRTYKQLKILKHYEH